MKEKNYIVYKVTGSLAHGVSGLEYIDSFVSYALASKFLATDQNIISRIKDDEHVEFIILPAKNIIFVSPLKSKPKIIKLSQVLNEEE